MALDEKLRVSPIASTVDRRCEYHSPRALTRKSANSLSKSTVPNFYDSLVGLQLITHYEFYSSVYVGSKFDIERLEESGLCVDAEEFVVFTELLGDLTELAYLTDLP